MSGWVDTFLEAGFSPQEVAEWSAQERQTLTDAGFDQGEIDGYIGGQPPQVPQPFLDRVSRGSAVSRVLAKIGAGAEKGWGTPQAMTPETEKFWRGVGVFNDPEKGQASPIRSLNEAVMRPIAAGAAVAGAAFDAAAGALGGAVGGVAEEAGVPMPERLGAETTNLINFIGADMMAHAPMVRVDHGPMGLSDVPIGKLPKLEDFAHTTQAVTGNVPAPQVYAKAKQLWNDHGIHPAEIAHDAARDVTITQDLASSTPRLPEAYVKPAEVDAEPAEPGGAPVTPSTPEAAPNLSEAPAARPAEPATSEQPGLLTRLAQSEEGTLRLAQPEPPRTPAEQSILDRLSIGERDAGRKWTWDRFYTAMVDRLHPIEGLDEDAYRAARLYAGVAGKADQFLQRGTFDFDIYANTGKSFRDIIMPVTDDINGFRTYATSLRALELEGQGIKTGMDLGAAREVAQAGATKYAPVMAELVQYQNRVLSYLRDSGVISDASYDAMSGKHMLYVPFQRVFGDVMGDVIPDVVRGQGKTLQASDPIHEIVGSERRVIDPLESIVRNTYLSVMMAERNRVGQLLFDAIDRASGLPTPERTDTISFYRNGVREERQVSADLAAAVKGLDEESVPTWLRLMGMPARLLRAGATLSPDFMLRNPIRDFFSAVINTTKGVFSPIDTAKGLMSAIHKDADYQEWLKGGGANSALVSLDRRYLQQSLAKLTEDTGLGTRAWNVVRHPIDTLRALSQLTEEATRLGEFRAARERGLAEGLSPREAAEQAAYTSREVTLDFARRGTQTRAMNMITAFFNAQIQGVDRLARAFHDDPMGTTLKIAGGITIPSVLLWLNNHNDPRYQEIPQWERDLFWIIITESHIFRIPKPFEVGVMFGSGPERLLDMLADQHPDAFRNFASSVYGALTPSFVPTVALPFVEQFANRSTFTDRPLIPKAMEGQLPEYQYNPYTTETAKALGQIIGAFPGIREGKVGDGLGAGVARALSSPILMENYLRAWTGGLGNYTLQLTDLGLRKAGVLPDPPKPDDTLADIPVVKAFAVRYPSAGAESIQRFYDGYDRNKTYLDTWKAQAKEGNIAAMQHIRQMGGDQMFVQLDGIKKTLAAQAQSVRNIYKNPNMSGSDKRQLIDQLYYAQIQVARHGVEIMERFNRRH